MDPKEILPDDFEWYKNQVAGHHPNVIRNGLREIGLIKVRGTKIVLKVVQEGIRGEREVNFYEKIFNSVKCPTPECSTNEHIDEASHLIEKQLRELKSFLPMYFGLTSFHISGNMKEFIRLEDIILRFGRPCIMDIKMGRVTFDPTADSKKRLAETSKCACQPIFGFRVLGYQMNTSCADPKTRDRVWGKSLTETNIRQAFEEYLLRGWPSEAKFIITQFIDRIQKIHSWFKRQRIFHFYASSLLLVYEGQQQSRNDESEAQQPDNPYSNSTKSIKSESNVDKSFVDVRMIDFSHVFPVLNDEADENYIHGLDYILKLFSQIRDDLHLI